MVNLLAELIHQHAEILEETAQTLVATAAALKKIAAQLLYEYQEQKTEARAHENRPQPD